MGDYELTSPILTSPPDLAPSDSTPSINHIFLPETKIFQIFKRMWPGFETNAKRAPKHAAPRQLHGKQCSLVMGRQQASLGDLGTSSFMCLNGLQPPFLLCILNITHDFRGVNKVTLGAALQEDF